MLSEGRGAGAGGVTAASAGAFRNCTSTVRRSSSMAVVSAARDSARMAWASALLRADSAAARRASKSFTDHAARSATMPSPAAAATSPRAISSLVDIVSVALARRRRLRVQKYTELIACAAAAENGELLRRQQWL